VTFFLDIETRATSDPLLIARLQASVKPPGNISKAETIATWWKEKAPEALLAAVEQTALDGTYGRVASCAWAVDAEAVKCVYGDNEPAMLYAIGGALTGQQYELVAFNGEFDFRFLKQRFIINRIKVPHAINRALFAKDGFFDPMKEWAGFRGYIKQVELERALGIDRVDDITGADIGTAIAAGDWASVEQHNIADVENLREIYLRMTA